MKNIISNRMSRKKALMLTVGRELLLGRISIAQAMARCEVKDKRTVIRWAKRALEMLNTEAEETKKHTTKDFKQRIPISEPTQQVDMLQYELEKLKANNAELLRIQITLTNRINDLEVLIAYAERTHHISVMNIKKRTS